MKQSLSKAKSIYQSEVANTRTPTMVRDMPIDEQPRERLVRHGAQTLSDAELLAIVLRSGSRKLNVVDLCRSMLRETGDLLKLSRYSWDELKQWHGMGPVKGIILEAVFELGRRLYHPRIEVAHSFQKPIDLYHFFRPILRDLKQEVFYVVLANNANRIVHYRQIASGTKTATLVDIQRVIKLALLHDATSLILLHNHPSGNAAVSQADKQLTKKIEEAAGYFSLRVLDHLIIAGNEFISFREEGLLV